MTRCIFSHIQRLLFNGAWAGANGGEIQIAMKKNNGKKTMERTGREKKPSAVVSSGV